MNPEKLAHTIRQTLEDDRYPEGLPLDTRSWIDAMYRAHGPLYGSEPEHAFTEEFLRRCGLSDGEIHHALGALHP